MTTAALMGGRFLLYRGKFYIYKKVGEYMFMSCENATGQKEILNQVKTKKVDQYTKFRYENFKSNGIVDPEGTDEFAKYIYDTMKLNAFSLIESETIVKELTLMIENDKKLILREPLTAVDKYKEEGI